MTVQDFCNLLGGGLVSFSTLSAATLAAVTSMPSGALICVYKFDPADVLAPAPAATDADASSSSSSSSSAGAAAAPLAASAANGYFMHAICWRGQTRTMNVMCGKKEIDSMKHQLAALGVLRPKINATRRDTPPSSGTGSGGGAAAAGAAAVAAAMDQAEAKEEEEAVVEEGQPAEESAAAIKMEM